MVAEKVAPFWRHRRYRGEMPTIQIKNVPAEAHAVLTRRAETAGQSLQQYLWAMLVEVASHPTAAEILDRIQREGTGSTFTIQDALDAIEEAREGR